jgi:hypothetical protein
MMEKRKNLLRFLGGMALLLLVGAIAGLVWTPFGRSPGQQPSTTQSAPMNGFDPPWSDGAANGDPSSWSDGAAYGDLPQPSARCISLGIQATDCTDYEQILSRLKEAWTAYTCPKQMTKGRTYSVALVLDPMKSTDISEDEAKEKLSEQLGATPDEVAARLTKIARFMSAKLTGAAFKIKPEQSQKLTVTEVAPVRWEWQVTPTEGGADKRITLTLAVHVGKDEGSTSEVQIKTLVEEIDVDVSLFDQVLAMSSPAQQVLTVGGSIATILSAVLAWLYRSKIWHWLGSRTTPHNVKTSEKRGGGAQANHQRKRDRRS